MAVRLSSSADVRPAAIRVLVCATAAADAPEEEVALLADLKIERRVAALGVGDLVDDGQLVLGVQLGVLLVVRHEGADIHHQVPVAGRHAAAAENEHARLGLANGRRRRGLLRASKAGPSDVSRVEKQVAAAGSV